MVEIGLIPSGASQIYYETNGNGPAVLFLHAGIADSRMWRNQMSLDGYRTVAFDQRGFGQTSWVPEPYIDWRDSVAVMDHLEMDSAVIVGCSLGGGIALHIALAVPDRVSALVLIGAAARGWEPVDGWADLPERDEALAASKAGDLEPVLELDASIWLAGADRSLEDIDPKLIELFIEMDRTPASTEDERDELVESFDPPVNERLADIHAPALAMVGAHDQPEMIESAEYLAGRLSDRPHVVIEGAAHLPSLEQPETFNRALLGFLTTL